MPAAPQPLVVVLGPTASGKSALAVALAQRCGGEVLSADAMAVYRGMDIGTAKPAGAELGGVPHHLLSCLEPEDHCDVSRWLGLAERALAGIRARARMPILAGGSPLYARALLEGLSAGVPRDEAVRRALGERYDREGGTALLAELARCDPAYAAQRHANDRLRIVRALEVHALTGQAYSSFHTTAGVRRPDLHALLIGLRWPRPVIHARIDARAARMFAAGLVDEVRALAPRLSPGARQAVGYKEVLAHLAGEYDLAHALALVQRNSRRLAKHQETWYRGWAGIQWIDGDAVDLCERAEALVRAEFPVVEGFHAAP